MKRMTARSFLEFSLPSDVRISPDGSLCAFLVRRADEQTDSYRSDLWVLECATGALRPLTARSNVQSYLFLPDGRLAFPDGDFARAGKNGAMRTRWLVISPCGGEARPFVTLPVDACSAQVLPDGRWLVTARTRPGTVERDSCCRVFDELPFWRNGRGDTNGVRTSLFLCDPSRQTAEQLTDTWFDVGEVLVQEGTVVFSGVSWRDMCPIYEGLYAADLSGGGVRTLIEPGQFRMTGPFSLGDGKVAVQLADRQGNPYAEGDIWEVDTRTAQRRLLTPFEQGMGHGSVSTDCCASGGQTSVFSDGRLYFLTCTGEDCHIVSMTPDGAPGEPLTAPGSVSCFDVRGGAIYMVAMRQGALPELYVLKDGSERQLSNFNGWVGQTYELPQPQPLSFFDEDGFEIHGFVLPPAGYRPGQKYPAVLTIHGGPRTAYGAVFFHEMQMFAARGYFVFFCNPRGSAGRGTAFADLLGRYGDIDYRNLMQFADECLRLWPDADPGRLCVMGGSYGGYMTNWMIGHTDRFRAACAQRSICDWISYAGTSDLGSWFNGHEHGAGIEQKLGLLWDISPISCAEKANTPTLFIHSDEDYRCHMVHALRMFTSLRMRGVDSRIVLFSGENHELSRSGRPRSRIRRLEEMAAWMDKYCLV